MSDAAAKAQEGPQTKRIDIKSKRFQAAGEAYYINANLSVARYVEYLKRIPKLSFHTTFRGLYDTLSKIYTVTSSGNDMIYAIQQARELSWNQLDAIQRFDENEIPDIIDFVALFCVKDGEDPGRFDPSEHETKKAAIAQEGYAVQDFFSLAFMLIDNYSEAYRSLKDRAASASSEVSRSPSSRPTSYTSSTTPSVASTRQG